MESDIDENEENVSAKDDKLSGIDELTGFESIQIHTARQMLYVESHGMFPCGHSPVDENLDLPAEGIKYLQSHSLVRRD